MRKAGFKRFILKNMLKRKKKTFNTLPSNEIKLPSSLEAISKYFSMHRGRIVACSL